MSLLSTWDEPEGERKRITPTDSHETVYKMWEAGIRDLNEIALETSYTVSYVRKLLRNRGYSASAANVLTNERVNAVAEDYINHMAVRKILKKHRITSATLYAILDEKDIPLHRNDEREKEGRQKFIDLAVSMYQNEQPIKEIFNRTGVTPSALYQELDNREIPLRNRQPASNAAYDVAVDMYLKGIPLADIDTETNVSSAKLYGLLSERNIPLRRGSDMEPRIEAAIDLYKQGATNDRIREATGVNSTVLYRAVRRAGIAKRNRERGIAQGVDISLALEMYDKGRPFPEIRKAARINVDEMIIELKKRGLNLRTSLPLRVTPKNVEYAVKGYENGFDFETIEVDTLVGRVQLLAELRKRGIEVRP